MKFDSLLSSGGLSLDRLRAVVAVVEVGSIAGAAGGDANRQSMFSRQIKEIEEALGVRLFERVNRRLVPTDAGRELALMTKSYFDGLVEISQSAKIEAEIISICGGESALESLVFPRLSKMTEALPSCRFIFEGCSTSETLERLRSGRTDIGIVRESAVNDDSLNVARLATIRFRLAVPRALLREETGESWKFVEGLPFAALRGGGELVRAFEILSSKAGVRLRVVAEADTFGAVGELVASGAVAAVLPEYLCRRLPAHRFTKIDLEGFELLDRELVIATHERKRRTRPLIDQAVEKLSRVWAP